MLGLHKYEFDAKDISRKIEGKGNSVGRKPE